MNEMENFGFGGKERKGCADAVGTFIGLLLGLLICAILSSCSVHKNVCEITDEDSNSLTEYIQTNVTKKDTTTDLSLTLTDSKCETTSVTDEEETETITERITETIDSLGNKTTTTDRTTTRKRKVKDVQQTLNEEHAESQNLGTNILQTDSLSQVEKHKQNESKNKIIQKETKSNGMSLLVKFFAGTLLLVAVMKFLWYVVKRFQRTN